MLPRLLVRRVGGGWLLPPAVGVVAVDSDDGEEADVWSEIELRGDRFVSVDEAGRAVEEDVCCRSSWLSFGVFSMHSLQYALPPMTNRERELIRIFWKKRKKEKERWYTFRSLGNSLSTLLAQIALFFFYLQKDENMNERERERKGRSRVYTWGCQTRFPTTSCCVNGTFFFFFAEKKEIREGIKREE